jgi:hypothetical protein
MEPKNGSDDAPSPTPANAAESEKSGLEEHAEEHAAGASADEETFPTGDGAERGVTPDPPDQQPEAERAEPLPPVPEQVTELAAMCRRSVQRAVGVALDLTPETLPLLDHYVKSAAIEGRNRKEALDLVAKTVAAYFGEVVRREYICWWHAPGEDISGWHLRFEDVYLMLSPYALACVSLGLLQPEDVLEASIVIEAEELDDVAAHLALMPPVSEEDFVLPSTRFDVLQIVIDQLKGRAEARNLGDVTFNDADYES